MSMSAMQLTQRSSHMAQAQTLRALRQSHARLQQGAAMRNRAAANARAQQHQDELRARQERLDRTLASILNVVRRPLTCVPTTHSGGAEALLFEENWQDESGAFSVLQCNTVLPGSGLPAAAMLRTHNGIELVDFVKNGVSEHMRNGRLFVFSATTVFSTGDSFVTLPARFESDDGTPGYWCFPTVGLRKNCPFVVGRGGIGTFIDQNLRHLMIARPSNFSESDRNWIWHGHSSQLADDSLTVTADCPFDATATRTIAYRIPALRGGGNVAALRARHRDDRGDPMAIFDSTADSRYRLVETDKTIFLILKANLRMASGQLAFMKKAKRAADGAMVFAGSGFWKEREIAFEIEANHRDKNGVDLFFAIANSRIDGSPVVALPLEAVAT